MAAALKSGPRSVNHGTAKNAGITTHAVAAATGAHPQNIHHTASMVNQAMSTPRTARHLAATLAVKPFTTKKK